METTAENRWPAGPLAAALAGVLVWACALAGPVPRQARLTVADFEEGAPGWRGGSVDTAVSHSGRASLRWDRHPDNPRLICTDPPRDWSGFEYLEFWLCSAVANGAELRLVIMSENPETEGPDYWNVRIVVDWTGWRRFRIHLPSLYPARKPIGWNHIDEFYFTSTGWGCSPKSDTCLWLDDVALTNPAARAAIGNWQRVDDHAVRVALQISAITDEPVDATVEAAYAAGFRFRTEPQTVSVAPTETRVIAVEIRWGKSQQLWQLMRQRLTLLVRDRDSREVLAEVSFPALRAYLATLDDLRRPRVLTGAAGFDAVRRKIRTQQWAREMWRRVERQADGYAARLLGAGPSAADRQDIETGRRLMSAALTLAFAYRVTGDVSYARAAATAIEAAGQWEHWVYAFHRPMPYDLGTAACLRYFGTAYDWIYDALAAERREQLAAVLWRRGLGPYLSGVERGIWWSRAYRSNWLAVCCTGAAMGAAATLGDDERSADVIADAYDRICRLLDEGGQDGGWPEGVGYWGYGIGHAAIFAELLYQLSGGQLNLFAHPYLSVTANFGLYMSTDRDGCVNFCDCGYTWPNPYLMLLLGVRTHNPVAVWFFRQKPSYWIESALIYDDRLQAREPAGLATSRHFRGIDWVVLRSGFDPDAVVVGLRGGNNGENHGMLEAGNFIVSYGTARLVIDYGAARYTHEYFSRKRWQFYRANTHGNNCLLIDDQDQLPGRQAAARTTFFETTPEFDFARMDLTAAYGRDAQSVERAVVFLKPHVIVMLDRARTSAPHQFTWRVHPAPEFKVSDGGFVARAKGKVLRARFVAPFDLQVKSGKHQLGEPFVDVVSPRRKDFQMLSVLWLSEDGDRAELTAEPVAADNAAALLARCGDTALIAAVATGGGEMGVSPPAPGLPGVATDAQALCLLFRAGKLVRIGQAGGSYLRVETR